LSAPILPLGSTRYLWEIDVPGLLFCADADHEVVNAAAYVGERPEWREELAERAKVIPRDFDGSLQGASAKRGC
jgi:hypothetical protein